MKHYLNEKNISVQLKKRLLNYLSNFYKGHTEKAGRLKMDEILLNFPTSM